MTTQLLLILLLGVSAYAMPKMRNPLEGELSAAQVASHLLMPGPVILPGKVENVDPNCVLCKKIVTLVDTMLKENATKSEMVKKLDSICEQHPEIRDACEQDVNTYLDEVIQALKNNMSAEMICERFGLCAPSQGNGKQLVLMNNSGDETCTLCQYMVTAIDSMLKQNATEQEIKEELEKVCGVLPTEYQQMCKEFVDEYVNPIITALAQMSPEKVCEELGLCTTNEIKVSDLNLVSKVNPIKASPPCELCEMVVKELDSILSQNSTQEEIEQALEQVCGLLPSQYKAECDSLVKQYEPTIVQILANEFSPDMICTALQLCSSRILRVEKMIPKDGNITCDLCQRILGIAKKLIEENDTEADVEKVLKLICWYMPLIKSECDDFIDNTVPKVFEELKKLDPLAVCKQLNLCPSNFSPNDVRCYLNGHSQCEDPELARKCGANC